jgi:Heparinase II/III-like protein
VLRTDRAHVFVDCGEVGMHGRGGHGHSDTTSLEVWLDGMNVVSDCGSYLYTASREWRNRFRSTSFHNVVQVDGEELNRLISPDHLWQLRDDARPQDVVWEWGEHADYFRGAHNGYARLDPPVLVTREVLLMKAGPDVLVRDSIDGQGSRELVWRFHLDPALDADIDGSDVRLRAAGRDAWLQRVDAATGSTVAIETGWVSRSYGVRVHTRVVVITTRASLPVLATYRIGLVRLAPTRLQTLASSLPAKRQDSPLVAANAQP